MPDLKVSQRHLDHDAYLYIRQSTPRQVLENTESTQRQYALRDRAVALGWPRERIQVIDCDLGKSGSHSAGCGRRTLESSRCCITPATPARSSTVAYAPAVCQMGSTARPRFPGRNGNS